MRDREREGGGGRETDRQTYREGVTERERAVSILPTLSSPLATLGLGHLGLAVGFKSLA